MLWSSWHNHTGDEPRFSYCADADMSMDVYRREVRAGRWRSMAITEHAFALAIPEEERPWPHQWYHQPARLRAYSAFRDDKTAQYLARLASSCDGTRIFSGLEVEVAEDGSLSMDQALWPYLDVVIGSVHYLPGPKEEWPQRHFEQLDMLLRYPIDILGHPFRVLSNAGPVPEEVIEETLQRARVHGVAVEINAHMFFEQDADVLARAVRLGLPISFGLDAHHRRELGLSTYFAQVLADSGVREEDICHFCPTTRAARPKSLVR